MATSVQHSASADERDPRLPSRTWATIGYHGRSAEGVLLNLSATGFALETMGGLREGTAITVSVADIAPFAARVVRVDSDRYGCRFDPALHSGMLDRLRREGPFASAPPVPADIVLPEPAVAKLPRRLRIAIILCGAILSWAMVIAVAGAVLRLV